MQLLLPAVVRVHMQPGGGSRPDLDWFNATAGTIRGPLPKQTKESDACVDILDTG